MPSMLMHQFHLAEVAVRRDTWFVLSGIRFVNARFSNGPTLLKMPHFQPLNPKSFLPRMSPEVPLRPVVSLSFNLLHRCVQPDDFP